LALAAGIVGFWLYHEDGWRRYDSADFHRRSLLTLVREDGPRLDLRLEELPDDAKRILYANLWELYDGDPPKGEDGPRAQGVDGETCLVLTLTDTLNRSPEKLRALVDDALLHGERLKAVAVEVRHMTRSDGPHHEQDRPEKGSE
jgi:hypothetical protein